MAQVTEMSFAKVESVCKNRWNEHILRHNCLTQWFTIIEIFEEMHFVVRYFTRCMLRSCYNLTLALKGELGYPQLGIATTHYQAKTHIRWQLISIWKSNNSYQATTHIKRQLISSDNSYQATTHINFANWLQIHKFNFKNKLLTNISNCNQKLQSYTDIYN